MTKPIVPYNKLDKRVAALWTRVSSQDQFNKNCSLETQREICERYAQAHNITIKEYFGGTFESAKSEGKLYQEMINKVARDREINVILVHSFDRFSRAGDEAIATKAYLKSKGIYVVSATQATDPDTAAGELMENLLFLFNKFENQMRRSKTYGGTIASLQRGDYCLPCPLGYNRHKDGKKLVMEINDDGRILRNAWAWRAQGINEIDICHKLNAMGLNVKYKRLNQILKNPIYCGYIVHDKLEGGRVKGNFEPLIDEETFNIANGFGHVGYVKQKVNELYPLCGHVRCADCGCKLTAYEAKKKHIHYYKCSTKHCKNNKSLKIMHMLYTEFLKRFQLKPELVPLFQKVIKLELGHFNEEQDKEIKTIKANKTEVENKIKKVQVRWGLGEISQDIYDTTIGTLQTELYKINTQLNSYSKKLSNLDNIAHSVSVIASKLGSLWENSNYEDRVKLQNLLFPEGILWDKVKENYRTMKINKVFEVISLLPNIYNDKKERNDNESASLSPQVEIAGFEPASKQGTNMLSTRLSWPKFSSNSKTQATNYCLIC